MNDRDMLDVCEFCGAPLDLRGCQVIVVNTPNTLGPLPGKDGEDVRWLCSKCNCWNGGEREAAQ